MVDLTLNETFLFLVLYLKCGKGETRRAGATTRKRACVESDSRPAFAEDGHQDDDLESSTYTITRLRNFRFLSGYLYIGL